MAASPAKCALFKLVGGELSDSADRAELTYHLRNNWVSVPSGYIDGLTPKLPPVMTEPSTYAQAAALVVKERTSRLTLLAKDFDVDRLRHARLAKIERKLNLRTKLVLGGRSPLVVAHALSGVALRG